VSYDLFLRPRSGELSREALLEYFTGTTGYSLDDDDDDVISYENEATGVYFLFNFAAGTSDDEDDEEDDDGDDGDGPEISFELDAFRPHIFALEARGELDALVAAFDLVVTDPQEGGVEGSTWDGDAFIRGWTRLNELSYATILRDEWDPDEPLYTLPRAEIEYCWRWNLAYEARVEELGERFFIANIAFAGRDGHTVVQAMWPDDRPIVLPRVAEVLLVRGEGKQQQTRLIPWDDLAAKVPALQNAAGHPWTLTEADIGRRLDPFFADGKGNVRITLVQPDRIHAIEDVERARSGKKKGKGS
jgi:hypothetical protein